MSTMLNQLCFFYWKVGHDGLAISKGTSSCQRNHFCIKYMYNFNLSKVLKLSAKICSKKKKENASLKLYFISYPLREVVVCLTDM